MYFARKPVRFDRWYQVGEEIPEEVISLGQRNRLVQAGKITPTEKTPSVPTKSKEKAKPKTKARGTKSENANGKEKQGVEKQGVEKQGVEKQGKKDKECGTQQENVCEKQSEKEIRKSKLIERLGFPPLEEPTTPPSSPVLLKNSPPHSPASPSEKEDDHDLHL